MHIQVDFSCGCSDPFFLSEGKFTKLRCDVHRDGYPIRLRAPISSGHRGPSPFEAKLDALRGLTTAQIIATQGDRVEQLMLAAGPLFDAFSLIDQAIVLAVMAGILWATIDGLPVEFERHHPQLITVEDRKKVHLLVADTAYRDAMEDLKNLPAERRH